MLLPQRRPLRSRPAQRPRWRRQLPLLPATSSVGILRPHRGSRTTSPSAPL